MGLATERVATHRQLVLIGIARSTIGYRIVPGGRWQRMHPGVVLMHSGRPTWRERVIAAALYAGEGSVISGAAALRLHGLGAIPADNILVLIPESRRRQSHGTATLERSRRLPEPVLRQGLAVAPLPRAVVDACRRLEDLNTVRNVVSDAIQNHGLSITALATEVRAAARQRTACGRAVIAEMDAGVRFAAEARARELILASDLPVPLFNAEVLSEDGQVIVTPDGFYPEWCVGYEIDSRRWHMSPDSYERTTQRRAYATSHGVLLLAVTPRRVLEEGRGFIEDLRGTLYTAQRRTPPLLTYRARTI